MVIMEWTVPITRSISIKSMIKDWIVANSEQQSK